MNASKGAGAGSKKNKGKTTVLEGVADAQALVNSVNAPGTISSMHNKLSSRLQTENPFDEF